MEHIRFRSIHEDQKAFFATIRSRVNEYFAENNLSKHCNSTMILKTVVLLSAYVLPFIAMCIFHPGLYVSLFLWTIMGLALSGIGMSVMHDANHGAYSKSKLVNQWLGHSLNMLGGSVNNWKIQHNILHHTYTNIVKMDDDIKDKYLLRFSPHTKVRLIHRLQFVYAFLFYGITTMYWVFVKDFIQIKKYMQAGKISLTKKQYYIEITKLIISKLVYLGVFIGIPIFGFHMNPYLHIAGYMLMLFISGIVLTVIFQLAHTVEGTDHPVPDEQGNIENNWAIHQMNTTVNFSRKNKILSWYIGGLNFQIEHHLFPGICHVHYPALAPIVKSTAEEFGIRYMENKTFAKALQSHMRLLKRLGRTPSLNDAIG